MGFFDFVRVSGLFVVMILLLYFIGLLLGIPPILILILGGIFIFITYWWSDSFALKMTGAQLVTPSEAPRLHEMVDELAHRANIPKPKVAIVRNHTPNAFATGRNHSHGLVAVHTGLLDIMPEEEVMAVLAHEISHIKHRDTLIQAIAASFGLSIMLMARMALFGAMFGDDRGTSPITALIVWIFAPIAAILIQLAISRGREYKADRRAAELLGTPEPMARALWRLQQGRPDPRANPGMAHMYIRSPLGKSGVAGLFSTHPDIEDRIGRLQRLAPQRR
ncbi:MAG: M48 family metalloprotease [Candidatus Hodarchaeales archaeon]|jgi:heat shock protein HtpX